MRSIRRHASHERPLQQLRLARHDANESAAWGAWGEGRVQMMLLRLLSVARVVQDEAAEVAAVEEVVLSEIRLRSV
jgi:hypothetical protein